MPDQIKPVYSGEAMLLRWGDNHRGRSVTLELDADVAEHPFKGLKCGENGQRMQLVAVLIDDNEQPMNPPASVKPIAAPQVGTVAREAQEAKTPFRALKRAAQAAILLDREDFQQWVLPVGSRSLRGEPLRDWAEREFKRRLGIDSKTELDLKPETCGKAFDLLRDTYEVETRWGHS